MRLNTIKPTEGPKKPLSVLGAALDLASVKLVVVAIKAKSHVQAVFTKSVLKAVRCLCSVDCLSVVSNH